MNYLKLSTMGLLSLTLWGCSATAPVAESTRQAPEHAELNPLVVEVARFESHAPAGVAMSSDHRLFVTFPWDASKPVAALGELKANGEAVPYPNWAWNEWDGKPGPSALRAIVCAQALTTTRSGDGEYLWVLDSGNPAGRGVVVAGPKLFKIDLADDSIAQVFYFDHYRDFAPDSRLSDLRIDTANQTAYLSDAQRGAIYVVDLKMRQTRCLLAGHASTRPEADTRTAGSHHTNRGQHAIEPMGVAGLELSSNGDYLYYHALAGRTLYRVPTAVLRDKSAGPLAVAESVQSLGSTGSAMDGLLLNRETGDLFMASLEKRSVFVRRASGQIETFVADDRLERPDSLALAQDGYLYLTSGADDSRGVASPSGRVLKVSLAYVEMALLAKREAEQAAAAAEESRRLAEDARKRQREAEDDAAHEEALASYVATQVAGAETAAKQAQAEHDEKFLQVNDAVKRQAEATEAAQAAADHAETEALAARTASELAAEAARIAKLRAEDAQHQARMAEAAQYKAETTEAQREAARLAYEAALADAEAAALARVDALEKAEAAQAALDVASAKAQLARDRAAAEAQYTQEFIAAADRAEALAAQAKATLEYAQLAEVRHSSPAQAERVEVADVPTE